MNQDRTLKILIIYGYHPKEIFAVEAGKYLAEHNTSGGDARIVEYDGRPDIGLSTHQLRTFVETFDPLISPLVLHGDDDMDADMAIIYNAKSKQEGKASHRPLLEFCFDRSNHGNDLIVCGRFVTHSTNYGVIDIELNSRMGAEKAAAIIKDFSQYLIGLYLSKQIKL